MTLRGRRRICGGMLSGQAAAEKPAAAGPAAVCFPSERRQRNWLPVRPAAGAVYSCRTSLIFSASRQAMASFPLSEG